MDRDLILAAQGFDSGYTSITAIGEQRDTGIAFGLLRLRPGEERDVPAGREGALLLMSGRVELIWSGGRREVQRASLFEEDPIALHYAAKERVQIVAREASELAALQVEGGATFETRLYDAGSMLESEHRGKGLLDDTAYRIVRTIFDGRNRPEANLVLGEVITFPGRWSSYPPHHHPQPEIYHYRFTDQRGYGHAELGDAVLKVRHGDTVKIIDANDHAQAAAPGYGMYYLWAIRHLPGQPYTTPEFAPEHRWLLDPAAPIWRPHGGV